MPSEVIQQLKKLQAADVNPRSEWMVANRARLLMQIKNTVAGSRKSSLAERVWAGCAIFVPRGVVYNVLRPVAVFLVVVLAATTAYAGTVKASYQSLPGDWLYPAKRATEQTQVVVASLIGDNNSQTQLQVEFAARRATEANQLIQTNDPNKVAKAAATVADLQNDMNTISSKLDGTDNNGLGASVAQDVTQQASQITDVLQDAQTNLLASPSTTDLSEQIAAATNLTKNVSVQAVEVMVNQNLQGDTSVTPEQVKQTIADALQNSADEVGQTTQTVTGVQTILETAKNDVTDLTKNPQNSAVTIASAQALATTISNAVSTTQAAVLQSQAVSAAAQQQASAGQALAQSGDFVQAVNALKAVNQASQEVTQISAAAVAQSQVVLPIVQVVTGATTSVALDTSTMLIAPSTTALLLSPTGTDLLSVSGTAASTGSLLMAPTDTAQVKTN